MNLFKLHLKIGEKVGLRLRSEPFLDRRSNSQFIFWSTLLFQFSAGHILHSSR